MPACQVTGRFERGSSSPPSHERGSSGSSPASTCPTWHAACFRAGLRVNAVQAAAGVSAMPWARDRRATFSYRPQQQAGEPHVIWRRTGTHDILRDPFNRQPATHSNDDAPSPIIATGPADSALEDWQVQASGTTPISAIPVQSIANEGTIFLQTGSLEGPAC